MKEVLTKKQLEPVVAGISILGCLFHFYTGGIGTMSSMFQTVTHWLIMYSLVFLIYPKKWERGLPDIILFLMSAGVGTFILLTWKSRVNRISPKLPPLELMVGVLLILLVLEAARRVTGNFLALTAIVFLVYAKAGPYLPGILYHKGYSFHRIISVLCYSENGIFGSSLSICATFIVLFVLFGAFLNASNGGQLFIDIAYSLTGWARGGPAKTAILSSLLMGCISGSPVANVVTTGTFTIPLMKKAGYESEEACAVEAVASTGGQIMPPVMGAAAFIMSEYIGIRYGELCIAAFVPAVLYYLSIFFIVDLISVKNNLLGQPRENLPAVPAALKRGIHLFIPIITLITCLIRGFSPMKTVFFSILMLVVIAQTRRETRMKGSDFISAMVEGITSTVPVAVACAAAGIIVGVVSLTGLGVKFSSSLIALSHGNTFLALFYTMIASIILGCGLPTTAVYIILASMAAPALVQIGVPILAAHMFVFYFGCISTITPPVALTSYAASGIGDANPSRTGIKAFLFGIVAYIVPYMFAFSPTLLMQGNAVDILCSIATAAAGVYILACGVAGYLYRNAKAPLRALLLVTGILLIDPNLITDLIGIGGFLAIYLWQRCRAYTATQQ